MTIIGSISLGAEPHVLSVQSRCTLGAEPQKLRFCGRVAPSQRIN